MKKIIVEGGHPLKGKVRLQGSKNSSLPIIIATCLSQGICQIDNVPDITDVHVICDLCEKIGVQIDRSIKGSLIIDSSQLGGDIIKMDKSICKNVRVSYYFMGVLIHLYDEVWIGGPGGDNIGKRPIDQHIKGFKSLGIEVDYRDGFYILTKKKLVGSNIYFDVITCGGTINLMLASVLAEGTTVLSNVAVDPEVVDLAVLLNKMGAKIKGAGTKKIIIKGVDKLHPAKHRVIPDRLVAGTLFIAASITGGEITVDEVIPYHLMAVMNKLHEVGLNFTVYNQSIKCRAKNPIKGGKFYCGMYPSFPTDLQQPLTALLLHANGKSKVEDLVFPARFNHCSEMMKMGADLLLCDGCVNINGGKELTGAVVTAKDIRGGISLLLAGLSATGTTTIEKSYHIDRGYQNVIKLFSELGANVSKI